MYRCTKTREKSLTECCKEMKNLLHTFHKSAIDFKKKKKSFSVAREVRRKVVHHHERVCEVL